MPGRSGTPTVIIGAGAAGRAVARAMRDDGRLTPIGFVDDAPRSGEVCGLPVLGPTADLPATLWPAGAEVVVVALPSLTGARVARLLDRVWAAGLDVRYVPPGSAPGTPPRGPLDRAEASVAGPKIHEAVEGRRVLVTGAAGTVGAALARRLRTLGPAALHLLDDDTRRLHRLAGGRHVAADLRDERRIGDLFDELRPDLVFHAAGHDDDPRPAEQRPAAAVRHDVRATCNLVRAAAGVGSARLVLVSSDEAADPTSVLGATRRLSELALRTCEGGATRLVVARTGSVLGRAVSPLASAARQAAAGRPLTVAHPDMTRHLATACEGAELALEAVALAEEAETFALDTGAPSRVLDAIGALIDGLRLTDVTIRFTGLGPGERLHARSFAAAETPERTAHPLIVATRGLSVPAGRTEPLTALLSAADDGDDDRVRLLMRRVLPEYRPPQGRR